MSTSCRVKITSKSQTFFLYIHYDGYTLNGSVVQSLYNYLDNSPLESYQIYTGIIENELGCYTSKTLAMLAGFKTAEMISKNEYESFGNILTYKIDMDDETIKVGSSEPKPIGDYVINNSTYLIFKTISGQFITNRQAILYREFLNKCLLKWSNDNPNYNIYKKEFEYISNQLPNN